MALVYLDTSALLALCLPDAGSALAAALWDGADVVATSRVADAQVRGTLAAAFRDGLLTAPQARAALEEWDRLWSALAVVEAVPALLEEAASLVVRHPLAAGEAVHVASALTLRSPDLVVGCFDDAVAAAARDEGLRVVP